MDRLKSAVHRTTQTINAKIGKSDTTADEDYDKLHREFVNSLTLAENFNKHIQQLIENFNSMTTVLTFVAEDLSDVYSKTQDEQKRRLAEEIMDCAVQVEKIGVQRFQQQILANVVGPINDYVSRFDNVKQLHKQRNDLVKEYDYFRNRVAKMAQEQNSKDPLKLSHEKEKMKKAKEDMETVVALVKDKMKELIDAKPLVFNGVTEQTIGNLIQYSDTVKKSLDKLKKFSAEPLTGQSQVQAQQTTQTTIRKTGPLPQLPPNSTEGSVKVPPKFDCEWHYLDQDANQQGPFTFAQLKSKLQRGEINAHTYVFGADLMDWKMIGEYVELNKLLSA